VEHLAGQGSAGTGRICPPPYAISLFASSFPNIRCFLKGSDKISAHAFQRGVTSDVGEAGTMGFRAMGVD
jgi:hypothetical protein